ncbi:hypothetical protein [Trichormus sp. NMC-1]|nr:hypothetical protein [Trichormus sp. NMC-1]
MTREQGTGNREQGTGNRGRGDKSRVKRHGDMGKEDTGILGKS